MSTNTPTCLACACDTGVRSCVTRVEVADDKIERATRKISVQRSQGSSSVRLEVLIAQVRECVSETGQDGGG
jgi:hypothetical protein